MIKTNNGNAIKLFDTTCSITNNMVEVSHVSLTIRSNLSLSGTNLHFTEVPLIFQSLPIAFDHFSHSSIHRIDDFIDCVYWVVLHGFLDTLRKPFECFLCYISVQRISV